MQKKADKNLTLGQNVIFVLSSRNNLKFTSIYKALIMNFELSMSQIYIGLYVYICLIASFLVEKLLPSLNFQLNCFQETD